MGIRQLKKLHLICEQERPQLQTMLAMSVQNHQVAGYFSTRNCRNLPYVEGFTVLLYD